MTNRTDKTNLPLHNLPSLTKLDLEFKQNWLTIWLNQPETRNALDELMLEELTHLFHSLQEVENARLVRGISLRGRGGVFCAGGNLKFFQTELQATGDKQAIIAVSNALAELFHSVHTAPQFTLVLIEGAAMAGGFGLACCADMVLCMADAKFAMTETRIGLSPAQIAPYVIKKLGYAQARRLLLTGARFDGTQAQTLGFADFIATDISEFEKIEKNIKAQVLACAPQAIAATKDLLYQTAHADMQQARAIAAENFYQRMTSDESREGIAAFFEKRKPNWTIDPE
ncbi:MAG: enoyl-CoA hydratase-related protein [Alphaproteobacteria bacterium]|nr:enoyl-CoA hydratase-related protein [Alphaproteobacteria bacterium]